MSDSGNRFGKASEDHPRQHGWDAHLIGAALASAPAITPTILSANTDNYAPDGIATCGVLRVSTDASRNLTGIVAPASGYQIIFLENVGANNLVLSHNVTSTAANRFFCEGGTSVTIPTRGAAILMYDKTASRWQVLHGANLITSLFAPDTWQVFYTNGSAQVTELALGAAGKVLQANGASSAPTFEVPLSLIEMPAFDMNTHASNTKSAVLAWRPVVGATYDFTGYYDVVPTSAVAQTWILQRSAAGGAYATVITFTCASTTPMLYKYDGDTTITVAQHDRLRLIHTAGDGSGNLFTAAGVRTA